MSAERQGGGGPGSPWSQWMAAFGQANPAFKAWETWLTEQIDKFVRSDAFLGQVGKAMEGSFLLKSQVDRVMEQSLRRMRLPTVGDLDAMHKRLDEVERRLDEVLERLEGLSAGPAPKKPAPKKPAPKKPSPKKPAPKKQTGEE